MANREVSDYGPPGPLSPELEAKIRIDRALWRDRAEKAEAGARPK